MADEIIGIQKELEKIRRVGEDVSDHFAGAGKLVVLGSEKYLSEKI